MKNIILSSFLLILISCSAGTDNTSVSKLECIKNSTVSGVVEPNAITLQILKRTSFRPDTGTPLANVVVQLDHNGVCVKSNAQGYVTFSALSNGEHDIHVFSSQYPWSSIYNVKIGELVPVYLGRPDFFSNKIGSEHELSYLSFSGNLTNYNIDNNLLFEFYADGLVSKRVSETITDNTYTLEIEVPVSAGTAITGTVLIYEEQYNPLTNERFVVDKSSIDTFTLSTQASKAIFQTRHILFSKPKPKLSDLLAFDSITIPNGFSIKNVQINSPYSWVNDTPLKPAVNLFYIDNLNKPLPLNLLGLNTFRSYDPFNFKKLSFRISAESKIQNRNSSWTFTHQYASNTSGIVITANIDSTLSFLDNQVGDLLTWSGLNQSKLNLNFTVSENITTAWLFTAEPNAMKLRIPAIPKGIKSKLITGKSYRINVYADVLNGSGREAFSFDASWTR